MEMLCSIIYIFAALLFATQATGEGGYGLDCSFPIHSRDGILRTDCGDLPSRQAFYDNYMQGCKQVYDEEDCKDTELLRLEMNLRQPQSMVNFTSGGFRKVKAPPSLQRLLSEFWENNKNHQEEEEWEEGSVFVNHWESPTLMVSLEDNNLEGAGEELQDEIWQAAQREVEEWTGMRMRPSSLYGIRVYTTGAVLSPHVDRLPLVSSCIVNVAQDVDEDWPLEVYDRFGNAVNVTMEPFDMVFYESHSLIHGRPFPLKGRYMANVFIHFEVIGPQDGEKVDEKYVTENGQVLPPYLLPSSPEMPHWLKQHPEGWNEQVSEEDIDDLGRLASLGRLEELKELFIADATVVNFRDENGWQPLHEATAAGQMEVIQFLIQSGADINSRTNNGRGPSALNIAKEKHGKDDPVYLLLQSLGAEEYEFEGEDLGEEEDYDEAYEWIEDYDNLESDMHEDEIEDEDDVDYESEASDDEEDL